MAGTTRWSNLINLITRFQALEYATSHSLYRRAVSSSMPSASSPETLEPGAAWP